MVFCDQKKKETLKNVSNAIIRTMNNTTIQLLNKVKKKIVIMTSVIPTNFSKLPVLFKSMASFK